MTFPSDLKSWLDAISGDEKFLMTLGVGIVDTILFVCGFLDQAGYLEITKWTVCVYLAGKTYEDAKS